MMYRILGCVAVLCFFSVSALGAGNQTITSFNKAKRLLHTEVYADHRETIYCAASYNMDKTVNHPEGFHTTKHIKRSKKIEWEHVVPAENFGRSFSEWREGHPECVDSKGKSFKGRKCAEKVSMEYRYMQADMYNLFPAIGAVNALRSNYSFTMLPEYEADFGSCLMKIEDRKAEPPENARGRIARTYLYMAETYTRFNLSKKTRQLMGAWNSMYPVSEWECRRARHIAKIQGNLNNQYKLCY
jgi:deoxyribonuclease-1